MASQTFYDQDAMEGAIRQGQAENWPCDTLNNWVLKRDILTLDGVESSFDHTKIERSKLYGARPA